MNTADTVCLFVCLNYPKIISCTSSPSRLWELLSGRNDIKVLATVASGKQGCNIYISQKDYHYLHTNYFMLI